MLQAEGKIRIPSGCAIAAVISQEGKPIPGSQIVAGMMPMRERSNGLGGGFATYGIYPDRKDLYALHLMLDGNEAKEQWEVFLKSGFDIVCAEPIPTRKTAAITGAPILWRYFVSPLDSALPDLGWDVEELVVRTVIQANTRIPGAYVFSSGKNMGVFKAVGYPEDVAEFYQLDTYSGYCWTAHGRYPTNTPGWWGGAHPFGLLESTIVHNGEISSYDTNRRFLEMFGYRCALQTDTEVFTYLFDYLLRRKKLTLTEAAAVAAPPFWSAIDQKPPSEREKAAFLRKNFSELMVTGPFSVILGFSGGIMALNDRLKLRPLVVGQKEDKVLLASEESAVRAMEPDAEQIYAPAGGEPVIVTVKEDAL